MLRNSFFIFFIAVFIAGLAGCGPFLSENSNVTMATIHLGSASAIPRTGRFQGASASIPSDVVRIRFTISATDMSSIERIISVDGKNEISETFDVPNGKNRHFLVEALDSSGAVLFKGEADETLDGNPVTIPIEMEELIAPVFSGIDSIASITNSTITISWLPAADNITPAENIKYLIYMSTKSGGQNFALPNYTTDPGATSFTATKIAPNNNYYYFIVRAKDENSNIDTNTIEKSTSDIPNHVSALANPWQVTISWNKISNATSYNIYFSTSPGVAKTNGIKLPNVVSPYDHNQLINNTPYYYVVTSLKTDKESLESVEVSATPFEPLPPGPPK